MNRGRSVSIDYHPTTTPVVGPLLDHTNTSACSRTCAELGHPGLGTLPLLPLKGIDQLLMPIALDHALQFALDSFEAVVLLNFWRRTLRKA